MTTRMDAPRGDRGGPPGAGAGDEDLDRDGDDRRGGKGRGGAGKRKLLSDEIVAKIDYKNPQILRSFVTDRGTPGTFVAAFTHNASVITFHGSRGALVLDQAFRQTPGASLVCQGRDVAFTLDTRNDAAIPHCDNYRREFEHFSAALLAGRPWSPSPEDALADAHLLEMLRRDVGGLDVPAAAS